jgi:hypothetical protein
MTRDMFDLSIAETTACFDNAIVKAQDGDL